MNKILLLLFMVSVMISCQRESLIDEDVVTVVINPPQVEIEGSITGLITDENGDPVANASIHYRGQTYLTDANGEFVISNTLLYEDGTYLTVEKDGYFLGSRTFYPQANETNQVRIELIENSDLTPFQTSTGGKVFLDEAEDAFVILPDGNYLQEDGSIYTGEVRVQGRWLDPRLESTYYRMPGDLTGLSLDREIKSLIPYGFAKVQLLGTNGELLSLPVDSKATIYFPIHNSNNNPSELNLWHFDEKNGIWVEEGFAELSGEHYTADVTHFTFWNITQQSSSADLDIELIINNMSMIDARLVLTALNSNYKSIQRTSDSGKARFSIPADTELKLDIFYDCEEAVETRTIAPLQGTNNKEIIELELTQDLTLTSQAITCSGEPVNNGLVYVQMGSMNYLYRTSEIGELEIAVPRCERTEYSVSIIDIENEKVSSSFIPSEGMSNIDICHDNIETGYTFDFQNINWLEEMQEEAVHSWTVSTIAGPSDKMIFNPLIENQEDDTTYFSGAFVINPDEVSASYLLNFDSNGFSIRGTCAVEKKMHQGIDSYRFSGVSHDIKVTDISLFDTNITEASFNVVYYN